ncbi:hypothetical protein CA51_06110 [Rosistilla oblonga]|uniref:DUF58 domain-containing protein n=1 Tax=Rosistilla oblonga TaxID=2527990 RepID=A0A518INN0_9BACT|nr:DUF58 domain-containing protein [Rosistilla oblonga]QDV10757.1 hypothetical protein CA51_06110 [Rosistilla oblonga]QDV54699.1 hypothetical protein Mal33_06560 [Rosistilla oblonga]
MPNSTTEAIGRLANYPWLLLAVVLLPLVIVALVRKTYPSRLWIGLLIIPAALSLAVTLTDAWAYAVIAVDAVILVVGLVDYLMLPGSRGLTAQRQLVRTASIGAPTSVDLTVINRGPRSLRGSVRDDLPEGFLSSPEQHPLTLPSRSQLTFRRRLTPMRRGVAELTTVYLEVVSGLRLWRRHIELPCESKLNVYPDMKQLSDYALLARQDRLSLIGVRQSRRIGQDNDFERLRDYSRDDNYRHIDWRTTARRNKLTVRQFQTDQSQRVIFMLDCGRMMTNEHDGMTLLDHALNSFLMMAHVALARGDAVGMLCFSDRIHAYIPPRTGKAQMNRLLQAGFNQFPQLVESRFDKAFLYLSNHCKQRSLVVMATNVIDEVNAGQVTDYLSNLVGKHLPLGILLRDHQLFDAADHPSNDPQRLYRAAAAAEILCWRNQVIQDMKHAGVLAMDLFPEQMTAPLVNQYLEIKAKHLL